MTRFPKPAWSRLAHHGVLKVGVAAVIGACALIPLQISSARADDSMSPQTKSLCANSLVRCYITATGLQESTSVGVQVGGRPGATVEVAVFSLDVVDGQVQGMTIIDGTKTSVSVNEAGFGQAQLNVAPTLAARDGGWALVSVSDAQWGDPALLVGSITQLTTRIPLIVGDGFGTAKPVAQVIPITLVGFIRGTEFVVEYEGDDGLWHDVTVDFQLPEKPATSMEVKYRIPAGLQDKEYRFRLRNVTDPSASPTSWVARPSQNPEIVPLATFVPPELGSATAALTTEAAEPSSTRVVAVVAPVITVSALLGACMIPVISIRRHRIRLGAR